MNDEVNGETIDKMIDAKVLLLETDGDDVKEEDVETEEPQEACDPLDDQLYTPMAPATARLRRQGSIWNSPLGLAATVFLAVRALDLVHRVVAEHYRDKRAESRRP